MSDLSPGTMKVSTAPMVVVANTTTDPRFQRLVEHLHALGPRPIGEFLLELAAGDPDMEITIQANLERYARLDADMVKAIGGDRFPAIPLHTVSEEGL